MALHGMIIPTWLGWLFGVMLLKHPWGKPSFPSWFSFSTIYSVIFLVVYIFITIDFLINNSEGLYQDDDHKFGRLIRAFSLFQFTTFTLLKRISFFINAKKVGRFMEVLYELEESNPKNEKKKFCALNINSLLLSISYISGAVVLSTKGVDFVLTNANANLYLSYLGVVGFSIVYFIFVLIPLTIVTNCVFAMILVTSQSVTKIFCEFCEDLRKSLPLIANANSVEADNGDFQIFNIIHPCRAGHKIVPKKETCLLRNLNKVDPLIQRKLMSFGLLTRQDVINRFEDIKDLMNLANEAVSALLLWFMCAVTLNLVTTASQVFVIGSGGRLNIMTDTTILILNSLFTYSLQVGHQIGQRQKQSKLRLYKEFLSLPWSLEKFEMEDVIKDIMDWEWKMTASGFFTVDRRLASGIFSLVLNYVMILVQLNIALMEPNTNCIPMGFNVSSTMPPSQEN